MMSFSRYCWRIALVITIHSFMSFSVASLPKDKEQPVYISSDRAYWRGEQNMTVYEGNVQLAQGTLKILADKITVYHAAKAISKVIATGQPANYQQQLSSDKGDIKATANTITFEANEQQLLLRGNASVYQDGTVLKGEAIDYDIRAAVINASSGERVQIVIPPKSDQ